MNNSRNTLRPLFLLVFGLIAQSAASLSYQEQLERCQEAQTNGNENPADRLAILGALSIARKVIVKELATPNVAERIENGFSQATEDGEEIALSDDELRAQQTLLEEWITTLETEWSLANPLNDIASGIPGGLVAIARATT